MYIHVLLYVQVIRSGVTYNDRAKLLVQIISNKNAQQFVHFVETLVSSENYSTFGRRLLIPGSAVELEEGEEEDDGKYRIASNFRGTQFSRIV